MAVFDLFAIPNLPFLGDLKSIPFFSLGTLRLQNTNYTTSSSDQVIWLVEKKFRTCSNQHESTPDSSLKILLRQVCGNIVTVRAGAGNGGKIGYKIDRFVINFDLFGDISLDEWLEEDEKNQTIKK